MYLICRQVMLLIGARSSAEKAMSKSVDLAPLESIYGAWRLFLFQSSGLMSLGRFKEAQILLHHAIPEADAVGQRFYQ